MCRTLKGVGLYMYICIYVYIYICVICLPTCHAMVRGVNQKSISAFQLFKRCGWATSSCSDSLPLSTCRRVRAERPKIAEGKSVASTRSQVFSISNPVLAAFVFPETVPPFFPRLLAVHNSLEKKTPSHFFSE